MIRRHNRSPRPKNLEWFLLVKPDAATGEFWYRWRRLAKHRRPILYFLQETLTTWISVKKRQWFTDTIWWVRYRTTHKNHIVDSGLKPNYYDDATLMLHVNFAILVKHVEISLAFKNSEVYKAHKKPLLMSRRKWFRTRVGRIAGLAYLDWMMSDEIAAQAPEHAATAKIIKRLYLWWKDERTQRIDAHSDFRIWDGIDRSDSKEDFIRSLGSNTTPVYRAALTNMSNTDAFYEEQDQAMLMKLVTIRDYLWA